MSGVTDVKLNLFTVSANSVGSVVELLHIMGRDVSVSTGRVMAQAVSFRPVTAESRVESQASLCDTYYV
jgi:hypothetical protein